MSKATADSFEDVAETLERFAKKLEGAHREYILGVGEEILTDVTATRGNKGVPRDEGTLANSGRVQRAGLGFSRRERVEISFGGAAAPYALAQHERTDFSHERGESRYLIRGLERWEPDGSAARRALKEQAELAAATSKAGA